MFTSWEWFLSSRYENGDGVYANIGWLITEIPLKYFCGESDKSPAWNLISYSIQFHIKIDFTPRSVSENWKIFFMWKHFRWTLVKEWFIKYSDRNLHLICDYTCADFERAKMMLMPKPQRNKKKIPFPSEPSWTSANHNSQQQKKKQKKIKILKLS